MLKALPCLLIAVAATAVERPPIEGQVTFLYYENLEEAARFYDEVLGLEKSFDLDWVKIFRIAPGSSVGLVNATKGSHKPSADKPVMLSLVVEPEEVDRWHSYLKNQGVEVGEAPGVGADGNVRAFGFLDPGGYTLEVFTWLK